MSNIHPTAIIHPNAIIAPDVEISPYVTIGADVHIDSGTWIGAHTVIEGPTRIGKDNRIFQFNSLGAIPQDKKYRNEPTELIIGDRNVIREYCTFNRGTVQDLGKTVLGDDNWMMAYVHLAHDCTVGNHTIFANGATLAGHVHIYDYAILGGFTLVHQFCRVGEYAFTGMGSAVAKDIPPYVIATGAPASPRGINAEGLRRNHFTHEQIQQIKDAYRVLYRSDLSYADVLKTFENEPLYQQNQDVQHLLAFCKNSQRGLIR